jgi:hypothetical protein
MAAIHHIAKKEDIKGENALTTISAQRPHRSQMPDTNRGVVDVLGYERGGPKADRRLDSNYNHSFHLARQFVGRAFLGGD